MAFLKVSSLSEAQAIIKSQVESIDIKSEDVTLELSLGRILSQPIIASEPIPNFTRSLVDGYAVITSDCFGANENGPVILKMVGEVKMGESPNIVLSTGEAIYVPTGGAIPTGANAMVMIEHTELLGTDIAILTTVAVDENITKSGDDIAIDEVVLEAGTRLQTHHLGVLAALGIHQIPVRKRLQVTILSTGDEIVAVDHNPIQLGQVRDTNRYLVQGLLESLGCNLYRCCHLKDNPDLLEETLLHCLPHSDVIIISGGSSAGEKDYTASVINKLGNPGVLVHGIAIKPGKPTIFGRVGHTALFGLPGHPAACFITLKAVVEPFIKELVGEINEAETNEIPCIADFQLHGTGGRDVFQMVQVIKELDVYKAKALYGKSGMVSHLANANAYVYIPMGTEGIMKGDPITATRL